MPQHRIIPRSEWGARYGYGPYTRPVGDLEKWLHHSVTVAPDLLPPFTDDYSAIRAIESIGRARFGSYAFPYTFAITPAGLLFEGHPIDRVGAHTQGHNTAGAGIVFVGNYENDQPTPAQLAACAWLLREGVRRGWWKTERLNGGHRDTKATACPGRHAYAVIDDINRLAARNEPTSRDDDRDPAKPAGLDVDGKWGRDVTTRMQQELGVDVVDGEISRQSAMWRDDNPGLTTGWQWLTRGYDGGSPTILAHQRLLKKRGHYTGKLDGLVGPKYIRALQADLGTHVDGEVWKPSSMVRALQRRLNKGKI